MVEEVSAQLWASFYFTNQTFNFFLESIFFQGVAVWHVNSAFLLKGNVLTALHFMSPRQKLITDTMGRLSCFAWEPRFGCPRHCFWMFPKARPCRPPRERWDRISKSDKRPAGVSDYSAALRSERDDCDWKQRLYSRDRSTLWCETWKIRLIPSHLTTLPVLSAHCWLVSLSKSSLFMYKNWFL